VLINRPNLRLHWMWIALLLTGVVVTAVWYCIWSLDAARWPGGSSPPGLAFGILGSVIILFEFLF